MNILKPETMNAFSPYFDIMQMLMKDAHFISSRMAIVTFHDASKYLIEQICNAQCHNIFHSLSLLCFNLSLFFSFSSRKKQQSRKVVPEAEFNQFDSRKTKNDLDENRI